MQARASGLEEKDTSVKTPRRGTLAAFPLLLLALLASPLPAAAAASPVEGAVSWSIAPATADGADGRVSLRYSAEPGASLPDHVQITNFSEQELTFDLAASDGIVGPDGAFDVLPAADEPTDVGAWVEIQPTVTVEALGHAVVPFTITVPEGAMPGDHPGGIVASLSRASAESLDAQVGLDARIGARIHLRVAGDVQASLLPSGVEATYEPSWNPFAPGRVHLGYTMRNDGNVRLGSVQDVTVAGLIPGVSTLDESAFAEQREVLPRQTRVVTGTIEGVWPWGRLDVQVTSLNAPVGEDVIPVAVEASSATVAIAAVPWSQVVVVLLLALVVWLLVRRARRRRAATAAALEAARAEGAAAARAETDLVTASDPRP